MYAIRSYYEVVDARIECEEPCRRAGLRARPLFDQHLHLGDRSQLRDERVRKRERLRERRRRVGVDDEDFAPPARVDLGEQGRQRGLAHSSFATA